MRLLDKAKSVAEQAATKAKEGVEDLQDKRELGQLYNQLGKETFKLIEDGTISHSQLDQIAVKIRSLIDDESASAEEEQPDAVPSTQGSAGAGQEGADSK